MHTIEVKLDLKKSTYIFNLIIVLQNHI